MKRAFALLFVLILSGCAFGHKTDYGGRSSFYIQPQSQKVMVAVHDMRPYVQNNNKSPNFTGIQKSIYGIPYNVTTKSGKPLADDFGLLIVNTMKFRKVTASQQEIPYLWSFDVFKQRVLGKEKGSKVYYLEMMEWKTETHFRPALHYDLKLLVFDDQANEVANNQEKGFFYFDKSQPGKENLATATSDILEKLFAEKKLNNPVNSTPPDKPQPEENQRLKSQDSADAEKDSLFKSLPPEAKDEIKKKCAKDYPSDFAMQADCANKQANAWRQLNK